MIENRYSILWHALEKIEHGQIDLTLPNGNKMSFDSGNKDAVADMQIKDWRVFNLILSGGDIAVGETYMEGLWTSSDLPSLITFFASNSKILEGFFHANKLKLILFSFKNLFRKNSKIGSKKNIRYHYDLGNDFYSLWLDETMTYSSAIFKNEQDDLKTAQENKYDRILSKIKSGKILEIGCGWGSFAIKAAQKENSVSCLTLSEEQAKFAQERVLQQSLSDKIEIKLQDYRNENGLYDSVVSIEMFEAVGKEYWPKYFETLQRCLKKDGTALIQTITIDNEVYKDYENRFDFIQKHIFPGGFLPSKQAFKEYAKSYNLKVVDEFAFGQDYKKTLLIWLKNFDKQKSQIKLMGFSDEFIRKWRFYLAYCAAGFASQRTDVVQFQLQKL